MNKRADLITSLTLAFSKSMVDDNNIETRLGTRQSKKNIQWQIFYKHSTDCIFLIFENDDWQTANETRQVYNEPGVNNSIWNFD